ncbi:MAG: chemotaxis protein CheW [Burkholderiaceae bacterium]
MNPTRDAAHTREVLRARAIALARRGAPGTDTAGAGEDAIEVLEFRLANERYAVETRFVHEVQALRNLTPLPCTPDFVAGVVNLRGQVVTVVDLKKFFHLPEKGLSDLHRIVLVGKGEIEFGLLADLSVGVYRIARSALQPPLPSTTGIGARYVQAITADSLIVLDMAYILADPALLVDESPDGPLPAPIRTSINGDHRT